MKRIIVVLVLCALTLSCLASCKGKRRVPDVSDEPPVTQSTKYNSYNGNPLRAITDSEKEKELKSRLTTYLVEKKYGWNVIPVDRSLAGNISSINSGADPLLVSFDPADYYYMCAYYNESEIITPPMEFPEEDIYLEDESPSSDDAIKLGYDYTALVANRDPIYDYTWVRFENPTDITEYHDGKKLVEAFQINRAFFVSNIKSENFFVPNVEHFISYETDFVGGYNINGAKAVSGSFIYLSFLGNAQIIFCSELIGISCVEIDGEYFVRVDIDGKNEKELIDELGYLHDELSVIMDTERYSEEGSTGAVVRYGIIGVREFAEVVKNASYGEYPYVEYPDVVYPDIDVIYPDIEYDEESTDG